jgi:uncharacterized membrane protein
MTWSMMPAATQNAGETAATLSGVGIETVARGFEVVGVGLLIVGSLIAAGEATARLVRRPPARWSVKAATQELRADLGRAMLVGLEFLVVADIINSVVIEPTLSSIASLGLLVLVRTFLSWSVEVEITGMWPWRRATTPKSPEATEI